MPKRDKDMNDSPKRGNYKLRSRKKKKRFFKNFYLLLINIYHLLFEIIKEIYLDSSSEL